MLGQPDGNKLDLEIADLTKKFKEANAKSKRGSDTIFYRTALRIAKARKKWENEPLVNKEPFFQEFRIGFMRKKVAIFQVVNGLWCGSYVPWKRDFGDKVEEVLRSMLGIA